METLISTIIDETESINDGRTRSNILHSIMSEVGELTDEVEIIEGVSYKMAGVDGVVGESIDIIISAVDMIYCDYPSISEEQLIALAKVKCRKWRSAVEKIS